MLNIDELETAIDHLRSRIANLEPRAESGEQHADLCGLYEELSLLEADYDQALQDNSQFGVGA